MARLVAVAALLLGFPAGVWLVDFEYTAHPGERPVVICLVAKELGSGRVLRLWEDEIRQLKEPPYPTGPDALFVAYNASAEISCHLALDWRVPERVLDLYVEYLALTNGKETVTPTEKNLLSTLAHFGITHMTSLEKKELRDRAMRGGPWTAEEQIAMLDYCETDSKALEPLLPAMLRNRIDNVDIDLERHLCLRSRYMTAVARMEHVAIPLDVAKALALAPGLERVRNQFTERLGAQYFVVDRFGVTQHVYSMNTTGKRKGQYSFNAKTFEAYLDQKDWLSAWPRTKTGGLSTAAEVFRDAAELHTELEDLHTLRSTLNMMESTAKLAIGSDGRNRVSLMPFWAKTSRNAPKGGFIFSPARWVRGLIKPPPGYGLAYLDWSNQEYAIAAILSGDKNLLAMYESGDPYLKFGKQIGFIPEDATKETHDEKRQLCKGALLGIGYGIGVAGLARRIGKPDYIAKEILRLHHETYAVFWEWAYDIIRMAKSNGVIETVFGWPFHISSKTSDRTIMNFPVQSSGSEMMRLACIFATEWGVEVCAPIHDGFLIQAKLEDLDDAIATMQKAMDTASAQVLDGYVLRSDVEVVRYPDRYMDKRPSSARTWKMVWDLIDGEEDGPPALAAVG